MRLNLGCGDRYAAGWWNVDSDACPHQADQRVDLTGDLPWPPASLDAVYCGHLLEHLEWVDCRQLLARLLPLMLPGAPIMVVGPDLAAAETIEAQGGALEVPLGHIKTGAGRWPGDEHRWDATPAAIFLLLQLTGWESVSNVPWDGVDVFWPVAVRGPRWQYAVTATAPEGAQ